MAPVGIYFNGSCGAVSWRVLPNGTSEEIFHNRSMNNGCFASFSLEGGAYLLKQHIWSSPEEQRLWNVRSSFVDFYSPTPTLLFRFLLLISSTRLLLLLYFLFFSSISPSLFLFIFLIVFAILSGGFHRFRFNWRIGRLKAGNLRIPLNTSVKGDGERYNWLYYQSLSNKSN